MELLDKIFNFVMDHWKVFAVILVIASIYSLYTNPEAFLVGFSMGMGSGPIIIIQ